jgi:hypothetical protein
LALGALPGMKTRNNGAGEGGATGTVYAGVARRLLEPRAVL